MSAGEGHAQPALGSTFWSNAGGEGVDFALFSRHATGVELCLFDAAGAETRIPVTARAADVWSVRVPGIGPGQRYGWRVRGPFAPREGHRFNRNKLLVDPYARAVDGDLDTVAPVYGYPRDLAHDDLTFCPRDDAPFKPKSIVVDDRFDWRDDRAPRIPWDDTVVYEIHVKGFTQRHPGVPADERGTFLGVASDASLAHLRALGVTTLELMPVQSHADEPALVARGLTNYWGYSPLAYFAPDARFASPAARATHDGRGVVHEFKEMVRRLHAAGFEVVLDVVYNHTCEGDRFGPTVSFRGIDNRVYYRHKQGPDGESAYVDVTGCGNSVDTSQPQVLKLVTDCLRYWVTEMHVDGFRFDLAPALGRAPSGVFDERSAFFAAVHQDPILSRVKLIAEPWDLGDEGYRLGHFPVLWAEYNGRFRDTVRRFWLGDRGAVGDLGARLTGSSDLFAPSGRSTHASVNFVTAHDGFTLRDLVSYARKRNESNGEENRDGGPDGTSQNGGVEGETDDATVRARRRTLARSLMATLFVSQGVPMLQMGDEQWRTQLGNNNAYCQDSELTWVDWDREPDARALLRSAIGLTALRKRFAVLRRAAFLTGEVQPTGCKDVLWLGAHGGEMTVNDWQSPARAVISFRLDGDEPLLVMMNGEAAAVTFRTPPGALGAAWRVDLDTGEAARDGALIAAAQDVTLVGGSLLVLSSSAALAP